MFPLVALGTLGLAAVSSEEKSPEEKEQERWSSFVHSVQTFDGFFDFGIGIPDLSKPPRNFHGKFCLPSFQVESNGKLISLESIFGKPHQSCFDVAEFPGYNLKSGNDSLFKTDRFFVSFSDDLGMDTVFTICCVLFYLFGGERINILNSDIKEVSIKGARTSAEVDRMLRKVKLEREPWCLPKFDLSSIPDFLPSNPGFQKVLSRFISPRSDVKCFSIGAYENTPQNVFHYLLSKELKKPVFEIVGYKHCSSPCSLENIPRHFFEWFFDLKIQNLPHAYQVHPEFLSEAKSDFMSLKEDQNIFMAWYFPIFVELFSLFVYKKKKEAGIPCVHISESI